MLLNFLANDAYDPIFVSCSKKEVEMCVFGNGDPYYYYYYYVFVTTDDGSSKKMSSGAGRHGDGATLDLMQSRM